MSGRRLARWLGVRDLRTAVTPNSDHQAELPDALLSGLRSAATLGGHHAHGHVTRTHDKYHRPFLRAIRAAGFH